MDRSCANRADVKVGFFKLDFDIAVLTSFFGQNLDTHVVVLGCVCFAIIPVHLPIEIDRRRTRRQRLAGHSEFDGIDGQPFVAGPRANRK